MIEKNGAVLEAELEWFYKVLSTRIKLHFDQECAFKDIFDILPLHFDVNGSAYGNFVHHYDLTFAERLVFVLINSKHQIVDKSENRSHKWLSFY